MRWGMSTESKICLFGILPFETWASLWNWGRSCLLCEMPWATHERRCRDVGSFSKGFLTERGSHRSAINTPWFGTKRRRQLAGEEGGGVLSAEHGQRVSADSRDPHAGRWHHHQHFGIWVKEMSWRGLLEANWKCKRVRCFERCRISFLLTCSLIHFCTCGTYPRGSAEYTWYTSTTKNRVYVQSMDLRFI